MTAPAGTALPTAKRARGGQPGNSNRLVHGGYRRRRLLNEVDWPTQLDRRTTLYRELRERTERIIHDAGGLDAIGSQRASLAPIAAQMQVELSTLNAAILEFGPVDRRRKTARKILDDRNKLLRTYRDLLVTIGLDGHAAERSADGLWDELARRDRGGDVRRAIAAPRGSQDADEVDSGDDADAERNPDGAPGLDRAGRSVPQEFPSDSDETRPDGLEEGAADG